MNLSEFPIKVKYPKWPDYCPRCKGTIHKLSFRETWCCPHCRFELDLLI